MIENLPDEEWINIENYEGKYMISNMGRVKSLERDIEIGFGIRHQEERLLKQFDNRDHLEVHLSKDGNTEHIQVCQLVAKAFITNPNNFNYVRHVNNDKYNNTVANLEWCESNQETEEFPKQILQIDRTTRRVVCEWSNVQEIHRVLGYNPSYISNCCRGKYRYAYNFRWKYKN